MGDQSADSAGGGGLSQLGVGQPASWGGQPVRRDQSADSAGGVSQLGGVRQPGVGQSAGGGSAGGAQPGRSAGGGGVSQDRTTE